MKNLILLLLCLFGNLLFAQTTESSPTTYPLKSMISIINNSLSRASADLEGRKIEIKNAEIALSTTYDAKGGGEFKLFVKATKKWQLEKATTVKFNYAKTSLANLKSGPKKNGIQSFENNLTKAIVKAATQWIDTKDVITGLEKNEFSVEISFMIKNITALGVEFEIWGVGADIGGEYENSAVHTVTLTFK
ncbi:hypothetical protein [Chryseobacterium indologenes]|uniref:hypothetical protein n=1 Tax=Chryseobacterium indologenes TaxID=253 RepID=UPI003016F60E